MEALLSKLYFDPKTGFIGADKLYRKAKAIDKSITKKQVSAWYKSQSNIQQFSNHPRKFPEFKIASNNPNEWQMDLAFWEKQPILIAVNINSRIGYAKALKNKQADTVPKAIDEFIKKHNVSALMSDNGSEFTNSKVEKFLDSKSISHANSFVGDHTVLGKIDRFIRTIKAILTKMKEFKKFNKLTQKILNEAITNYNSSYHSSIDATPNGKVMIDELAHNDRIVKQVQTGIPVGSIVRYRLKSKTPFDKEGAKFSKTTYEVIGLDGLKMRIRSKNNHILYKPVNDLMVVKAELTEAPLDDGQIWEAESILEHKKMRSGKYKYYIKWKGYDEPSWESQDNLRLTAYVPVRGGSYTNASDERLKTDIIECPYGLDTIMQMRPKKFKMAQEQTTHVGFIAQDMYDIVPESVTVGANDDLNEEGFPINAWGIDLASLTSVLCKAIQELKAELDDLKKTVASLQ